MLRKSESMRATAWASRNRAASKMAFTADPLPGRPKYVAKISRVGKGRRIACTDSRVPSVEFPSEMKIADLRPEKFAARPWAA